MRTKQFPVLGLILALFFGARTANRPPTATNPAPNKAGQSHSLRAAAKPSPVPKGSSALADGACRDNAGTAEFEKSHWWLAPSSQGCTRSLSPVWREICKINPAHPIEENLLAPELTGEQFIAQCLGQSGTVGSMMAAVPNPHRTHLGLMTDRAIEAIQVSAAEAHFLPVSHYLPWPSPGAASASSGTAPESQNQPESSDPGVLVFRDADSPFATRPRYLLVFLIPEMPTEGLDRRVFSSADRIIAKVSPHMDAIRFAGPNFSGSVSSLGELGQKLSAAKCIHAISGSVTNADPYGKTEQSCSTFAVTQTRDRDALCKFVQGAASFGYRSDQIAILSEEGTQYGRQSAADDSTIANPCKKGETAQLWFLHFPREISKLRNAYGAETGKAAPADPTPQAGLGLQWQDAETTLRDDSQTYGERQTPLSQEAVLSTLSITLKAQGIKALGILATDPMDEAFLIHSIKQSSPDVRLFVRDPDLLFLRTPDVGTLNGTLLISNYPLIPQNQFWSSTDDPNADSPSERHLITFPSAFQEGEYNAFVQLLEDANWSPANTKLKQLEWEWPAGMSASQESAADESKPRPLWLATIGTAGHYPIKVLNYEDADKASLKLHSLELGPPQLLPMAFWGLIAMAGLLHVFGLRFRGAVPAYFKYDFDLSDRATTVTLVRLFCHMMAILTITLAEVILGSSYLFFFRSGWRYTLLAVFVSVATTVLLGAAGTLLRRLYVLYRQQEGAAVPDFRSTIVGPKRVFRSGVAGFLIMVGAGAIWVEITVRARFDNAFLHFRDLSLSSGVAPTLPLASVLLVVYFGVWAFLRRLSYWEHRYTDMFDLKLDQVIQQDLSADVKAIDACLLGPLENRKWMTAFWVVLGLSIFAFRPWITLDMIEPSNVSRFALFFFILALLTLWLNWFRFINIWVHLRNILEHLENLPLRTAFQRLPREKSLPILHWSSSQNSFLLRQVLDRLRALARADASAANAALQTEFEARIDALMNTGVDLKLVERRVVGGSASSTISPPARRREDKLREAREEMTRLTGVLSTRLLQDYWRRGSSSTGESQEPAPADLKNVLAEDIVALPFYAYIRKVICELRNILFFLGVAVSLLFAALHTYAFRADQAIDWWFFGLFASMGGGVVVVIAQLERNALVSRLSDRSPGELGTNFYLQLLKYGTVPILTIFGSQVPSVSNLVLKWVQPALEALH
jgi:hypothetical protein